MKLRFPSIAFRLSFLAVLLSCSAPRKMQQKIEPVITHKDTAQRIIVRDQPKPDSGSIVSKIVSGLAQNRIDFKTFSARAHISYQSTDDQQDATAYIHIRKDSAIWVSLTVLTIEGYRLLITPDSVKLMNPRAKTIQLRSVKYLQELAGLPVDFGTLQDVLMGNAVFINGRIASYKQADKSLQVLIIGDVFKHLLTLDNTDHRILHSKLDDVDSTRNRTCDITFGSYEQTNGRRFSTQRDIAISEQSRLGINIDYRKYSFDEPVSFSFNIPKNYKRL